MTPLADAEVRIEPLTVHHVAAMDALARDDGIGRFTRVSIP